MIIMTLLCTFQSLIKLTSKYEIGTVRDSVGNKHIIAWKLHDKTMNIHNQFQLIVL